MGCADYISGTIKGICGNYLGFRGAHFNEVTLTQGSEGPPPWRERHFTVSLRHESTYFKLCSGHAGEEGISA